MKTVRWLHGQDLHEAPFLCVVAVVFTAIVTAAVAPEHWLRAVGVMSFGLGLGGLARAVFSDEQAGLLRIRGRAFDVTCYWIFAFLTGFFGVISPGR